MFKKLILLSVFLYTATGFSQHLYAEKFEGCKTSRFCLDCGSPKVILPPDFANQLISKMDSKALKNISGELEIQVLVDSLGTPCLLSAQNRTNVKSKKLALQEAVNNTTGWEPSYKSSVAQMSSLSLMLVFSEGNISIKRKNFDSVGSTNMKSTGTPQAKGSRKTELSEAWTVYTQQNSELPWDMCRAVAVDKDDAVWLGTDNGVVKIANGTWQHYNNKNTALKGEKYDKNKTSSIRGMAVDNANNKWFIAGWDVYKYDNNTWTVYDSVNSPISWARRIFIDDDNNAWFTSWDGLAKFDGKKWTSITTKNSALPSDKTFGVVVDRKKRVWAGTDKGNICFDGDKAVTFLDAASPLSKAYIMQGHEDRKGNLWFALYKEKAAGQGIYILKPDGTWQNPSKEKAELFDTHSINHFFLDEERQVLWVSLSNIGILKYTIATEKWEVYTTENSDVPSVNIEEITQSNDGTIWAATYAGIIKLNKK